MGRKVDLMVVLSKRINRLRKIQYFIEKNDLSDEIVEGLIAFLEDILSDNLLEIIEMDLKEAKSLEDWSLADLRKLGQKLRIKYWSSSSKDELILQIKNRECEVMLYYPNFVKERTDGDKSETPTKKTGQRKRRRYTVRTEDIRAEISKPFEHGSSFGVV